MHSDKSIIVIGSGPAGAQAAQTLVEAGVEVTLIDVGYKDDNDYESLTPDEDFVSLRKNDTNQHTYFLGKNFESIQWGKTQTGAQLTPSRRHIIQNVNRITPIKSENFKPMESLAYGGLGAGWGIGCCVFSNSEIQKAGLDTESMYKGYEIVAERIGVTASNDDIKKYTNAELKNTIAPHEIDENSKSLLRKYTKHKQKFNQKGIYVGKPSIALLTESKAQRKATNYKDLDFYSDKNKSAYRPWITIEYLKSHKNFKYINQQLVLSFKDNTTEVEIETIHVETKQRFTYKASKVILTAGVMGTARIVLRSFNIYNTEIPLLCNEYRYAPYIQLSKLGKVDTNPKHSFAQLSMFYDQNGKNEDVSMASLYSYGSLMLFRLIKEAPINMRAANTLMRYISPAISILGIHFPDRPSKNKNLKLVKGKNEWSNDILEAEYSLTSEENKIISSHLKKFNSAMIKLGCLPLKIINPGHGSSIHYAGTFPFSSDEKHLHLSPKGKIWGTKNVYIADSSGFKYLPAKGITFSLMANACNVATNVLNDLKNGD